MEKNYDRVEDRSEGMKYYFLNDIVHRVDGPAVMDGAGYEAWYLRGEFHRTDGPAVVATGGFEAYYIHGVRLPLEEFIKRCGGGQVYNPYTKTWSWF